MSKLISISKLHAIKIMKENFKNIFEYSGCDNFMLLPYDLKNKVSVPKMRIAKEKGLQIIENCNTFVLYKDEDEDEEVSVLSMYTELQKDIYSILPIGIKYDLILLTINRQIF